MDGRARQGGILAVITIGIVGVALIAVFLMTPTDGQPSPSTGSIGATPTATTYPTPAPTLDPLSPLDGPVTVVDGRYDDRQPRVVREPTQHKNQSKLFYVDGSWWGILQVPTSREAHIQRLDWATQRWHDTGVLVDERPYARADALVVGNDLYIASAGGSASLAQAVRVSSFHYDPASERWSLRPDFPVTINAGGVESSLIERAGDGRLWVTYIQDGHLYVSHSTDDDHHWASPYRPVVTGADVGTDQVGMVVVEGEVVLLWSNQNDEAIYVTSHREGRPDGEWQAPSTVVQGLKLADNHVNMKALPDGRIFAAVKTSLDTVPNNQPGWDQVLLLQRDGTTWTSHQVSQVRDKQTRPILLLDTAHGRTLLFATTPTGGGEITMKTSPFASGAFATGRGTPVISTGPSGRLNDATSTKQPVDASTGLVVLSSDEATGRYVHLAAGLGGTPPGRPAAGAPPDGPEPAPAEPVTIVDEPMDTHPVGDTLAPPWGTSPNRRGGTMTYATRAVGDIAVSLRTTGRDELRPCRPLGRTDEGRLALGLDVRLDRQGRADSLLLMARGDGSEVAALRADQNGRVRVSERGRREDTGLVLTPGRWYRVELDVDLGGRTFTARIRDAGGRVLLERRDRPWRTPAATAVESMCVAPSFGAPGLGLSFDTVSVVREP